MGFSVMGDSRWNESSNWKPSDASQQTGIFKNRALLSEFMDTFKVAETNLTSYGAGIGQIKQLSWFDTSKTHGAVQLGDLGATFDASKSPNAKFNIFGGKGDDTITGGDKGDFIQGQGGNDTLYGLGGNDELWGSGGTDKIYGGSGRDALYGNDGNDNLFGDAGADLLLGGQGDDTLDGGDGDDVVFGGEGNDKMRGGKGADRFYLSELSGAGTKIQDFKAGEGDNIWIIDNKGKKSDYSFVQDGENVLVKNKAGTVMATVENAKADDVKAKTEVGPSRFENYASSNDEKPAKDKPGSDKTEPYGKSWDSRDGRSSKDAEGNQDIWGRATGGKLNGGKGDDILHALGGKTQMAGGAGADHFHVKFGSGTNTIRDFNFQQQDRIVIDELPGNFDKSKVDVKSVGDNFVVSYDGKEVATLNKFDGMPMTDAINRIKDAVRGGQKDAEANYYYGLEDIGDLKKSGKATETFTLEKGEMTYVDGFAYSAGQRLKLDGVDAKSVKTASTENKVTLSVDGKDLAVITPPDGTTDFKTWHANVVKALKEIGVQA